MRQSLIELAYFRLGTLDSFLLVHSTQQGAGGEQESLLVN